MKLYRTKGEHNWNLYLYAIPHLLAFLSLIEIHGWNRMVYIASDAHKNLTKISIRCISVSLHLAYDGWFGKSPFIANEAFRNDFFVLFFEFGLAKCTIFRIH